MLLIISLKDNQKIPKQNKLSVIKLDKKVTCKALFSGQVAGFLTSMFPGLGAAQAAVIGMQIARKIGDHGFMILIGSVNTVNFVLSLVTFYLLDKARNGAVLGIQKILENVTINHIIVFLPFPFGFFSFIT